MRKQSNDPLANLRIDDVIKQIIEHEAKLDVGESTWDVMTEKEKAKRLLEAAGRLLEAAITDGTR